MICPTCNGFMHDRGRAVCEVCVEEEYWRVWDEQKAIAIEASGQDAKRLDGEATKARAVGIAPDTDA